MQRGLLGQVTVGDQPRQQMHHEMVGTAMARMLALTDVLELVIDALNDRPLAQQELVDQREDAPTHVLASFGDQVEAVGDEQFLGERLGEVALVARGFAKEPPHQAGHRPTVVHVARSQAHGQEVAAVVDDQMELEAIEPAHGRRAVSCIGPKDAMGVDARGAADAQASGIDQADARTRAELRVQTDRQGQQHARHESNEACIADHLRELGAQLCLDMLGVKALEGAIARLFEQDQVRHHLAGRQSGSAAPLAATRRELLLFPPRGKLLPERIHRSVQVEYTHARYLQLGA